jgi:hypothetical protein
VPKRAENVRRVPGLRDVQTSDRGAAQRPAQDREFPWFYNPDYFERNRRGGADTNICANSDANRHSDPIAQPNANQHPKPNICSNASVHYSNGRRDSNPWRFSDSCRDTVPCGVRGQSYQLHARWRFGRHCNNQLGQRGDTGRSGHYGQRGHRYKRRHSQLRRQRELRRQQRRRQFDCCAHASPEGHG